MIATSGFIQLLPEMPGRRCAASQSNPLVSQALAPGRRNEQPVLVGKMTQNCAILDQHARLAVGSRRVSQREHSSVRNERKEFCCMTLPLIRSSRRASKARTTTSSTIDSLTPIGKIEQAIAGIPGTPKGTDKQCVWQQDETRDMGLSDASSGRSQFFRRKK